MHLTTEIYLVFGILSTLVLIAKAIPFILKISANTNTQNEPRPAGFSCFQSHSVAVFLMAMGANWFYGPHLMELYEQTYKFNAFEQSVLMSIGFITAALSGLFIGNLADALGRKKACILYALCYGITVLCHHFNDIYIISVGRAFAGVATSLLYCVFESWMIAAHNERGYPGKLLGSTFNLAWGLNYPVAIIVALLCQATSKLPHGFVADFEASLLVLFIMVLVICFCWSENYGTETTSIKQNFLEGLRGFNASWNVKMLSIIQTFFEGSMFVFVRFWWSILHEAHGKQQYEACAVFALFMINCMVGTELLGLMKLIMSKKLISILNCAIAAISLFLVAFKWTPFNAFYWKLMLFCIYEICVGIYFNVMTDLRGELIDDSVRGTVTALCRVPLNFIVVGLLLSNINSQLQMFCIAGFNAVAMLAAFMIRKETHKEISEEKEASII